jgi:hypothetical protein
MSIVNFFFWIMLILLGLLAGLLIDANNRSERLALAELERINRMGRRVSRRATRPMSPIQCLTGSTNRLQPASGHLQSAGFFAVGVCVDKTGDDSREKVITGEEVTFDFSWPRGTGYDSSDKTNERAALTDCPSCA